MHPFIFAILLALAGLGIAVLFLIRPIAQPLWYHDFADQRSFLGIPNFCNVISNVPFLFVGGLGIWHVVSGGSTLAASDRWMYLVLFAAIVLTGVSSAYYHLDPNNNRLVWDRLPIAVTFMALLAIIIAEHLDARAGKWLFAPLIMLGAASVCYWHLTETWGRGDLRFYLLTQLYPAVAIPLILWLCPARYTGTENLYAAMAWYAGAKVYELMDKDVFSFGQVISGHTLKHVGSAVSCHMIFIWIRRRRLLDSSI